MLLIILLSLLVLITLVKFITFKPKQYNTRDYKKYEIDIDRVANRLSSVIQCKTISYDDYSFDPNEFGAFISVILESYPLVFEKLEFELINDYSLLFKWKGEHPDKPSLLMAHFDVVPVQEEKWSVNPFDGVIKDEKVFGRGALDDKSQMITQLEAISMLLKEGYTPKQDIYFAYGHDEEVGGSEGQAKIVEHLKESGVKLDMVLDEGGVITEDAFPGLNERIATIGIAEKGCANVTLSAKSISGHASAPPNETAIGKLAKAINKLEKRKFPLRYHKSVRDMFNTIGPYTKGGMKYLFANLWLFRPMFMRFYANMDKNGNALLRTTVAPTMLQGSKVGNVLPSEVKAVLNCRINPEESVKELLTSIQHRVGDGITVEGSRLTEPSVSLTGDKFTLLEELIYSSKEAAIITPYLMTAATDSVHYKEICDQIYKFSPMLLSVDDRSRIHTYDEFISFDNIKRSIEFFINLLRSL